LEYVHYPNKVLLKLQKTQFQKKQKIENVTLLKLKNVISEEV